MIEVLLTLALQMSPERAHRAGQVTHMRTIIANTGRPVPSRGQWAALRLCESHGRYDAISATGKYRGAYQFDRRTWASYGPAGDPAKAPRIEQDLRAMALYASRGAQPWPHCGRHLPGGKR